MRVASPAKKALAGAAHARLDLNEADLRGAKCVVVWRQAERVHAGSQRSRLAVGQHAHPALSGGGVEVHSVLHSEFDHVGAGQADGVFRRVDLAVTVVEGAHAEQRGHIGDFEHLALFRLRATGADARLGALERNACRILKKIMQRAAGEMLEHGPEGEVRKVVVYLAYRHAVNATQVRR